jgi:hypothetical protein
MVLKAGRTRLGNMYDLMVIFIGVLGLFCLLRWMVSPYVQGAGARALQASHRSRGG